MVSDLPKPPRPIPEIELGAASLVPARAGPAPRAAKPLPKPGEPTPRPPPRLLPIPDPSPGSPKAGRSPIPGPIPVDAIRRPPPIVPGASIPGDPVDRLPDEPGAPPSNEPKPGSSTGPSMPAPPPRSTRIGLRRIADGLAGLEVTGPAPEPSARRAVGALAKLRGFSRGVPRSTAGPPAPKPAVGNSAVGRLVAKSGA